MQHKYRAALAGLILTSVLSGCGAVTSAQQGQANVLPPAPPAPTHAPVAQPPAAPALPALARAGAPVLEEKFDAPLQNWEVLDILDFPYAEPSTWRAVNGRLDLISGPNGYALELPTMLLTGDGTWQNYTIQAMGHSRGNDRMGLVGRASERGLYALVLFSDRVALLRFDAATEQWTGLATSDAAGQTRGVWTALGLSFEGDTITGLVNGAPVITATDSTYGQGKAGLYGYAQGSLSFDQVVVSTNN